MYNSGYEFQTVPVEGSKHEIAVITMFLASVTNYYQLTTSKTKILQNAVALLWSLATYDSVSTDLNHECEGAVNEYIALQPATVPGAAAKKVSSATLERLCRSEAAAD